MKLLNKPAGICFFLLATTAALSFTNFKNKKNNQVGLNPVSSKIQVAILLDVSGSMDGLIEQAKAQLWNMVNTIGKAHCSDNSTPKIEIALYEYGRSTNNVKEGYVKKLNGFISDLDSLSQNLFSLTTNGGDEFCGHVIYSAINELNWDASPENYKVIFIAGNEDFLQGDVHYTRACNEARQKAVIVNTIYCGDKMQGISEHWNLNAACGNGSYTNINQDARFEDIPTPYDSIIFSLNEKLNGTYMAYGYAGAAKLGAQSSVDQMNYAANKEAALKRVVVKSNSRVYKNGSWDLVDADGADEKFIDKLDKKSLPDSLKNKTTEELKRMVKEKSVQRSGIQKQISEATTKRESYIAAEKAKNAANNNNTATLETEVEKIIREQAKRFNMKIE